MIIMPTRGKVRIISHRRRREGRTDFRSRLALVKSGKPRFIVRKSVNAVTCQVMNHDPKGDRAVVSVSTKNLADFGWKGATGNIPAAYLTGFLCGTIAKKSGVKAAVLDLGLQTSTKGSRLYGALKGALDAGINIPHSEDVLPPIERVRGQHIEQYSESQGKKKAVSTEFDSVKKSIESDKSKKETTTKKAAKKPVKKAKTPAKKKAK